MSNADFSQNLYSDLNKEKKNINIIFLYNKMFKINFGCCSVYPYPYPPGGYTNRTLIFLFKLSVNDSLKMHFFS